MKKNDILNKLSMIYEREESLSETKIQVQHILCVLWLHIFNQIKMRKGKWKMIIFFMAEIHVVK